MFQYYLRAAGLALSWVGTGRLIFSLNYTDADFSAVCAAILAAARAMQADGWWWASPQLTNKSIRRNVLKEMVQARCFSPIGSMSSPRIK
jgi:glutamate-1-semialdehyde 2,1-aminomutase